VVLPSSNVSAAFLGLGVLEAPAVCAPPEILFLIIA